MASDLQTVRKIEEEVGGKLSRLGLDQILGVKKGYAVDNDENVIGLNLSTTWVKSVSSLRKLKKIQCLDLRSCAISDISIVKSLKHLTYLHLGGNQISDIVPLQRLKSLRWLHLGGNSISDISSICNLTHLEELHLGANEILEIKPIGNLVNLKRLNLSKNKVHEIPDLSKFIELRILNLESNIITDISNIAQLKILSSLNLGCNKISDISTLKNLIGLKALFLANNRIRDVSDLGSLRKLRVLNLSNNFIDDFSALDELSQLAVLHLDTNSIYDISPLKKLTELKHLLLNNNNIVEISPLKAMRNLRVLDLRRNLVSQLPKEITELGMEVKWSGKLHKNGIFLADNPLEKPPIEIVKQGTQAVRNYFESVETEEVSRVYEAKLLIVGEGGVGKTCLMKRLMKPDKVIDQKELTTKGIEINQWRIDTPKAKNFKINFWDFGGQEIYHATHQFFLTKRSLYLFVWSARKDDDLTSFDYWLNIVKLLSDNSPVIVVLNKIDERIKTIDEQSLQGKFENVKFFDRVSALQGTGIDSLTENIRQQINELPHIGDVLPTVWVDIRRRLEGLDKNYISWDEYKAICSTFGLDEERAEFLSRYYHDLGVFLHFLDNAVLREIVFLKSDWATNAVYKVVDAREIQENYGEFHFKQLKGIWNDYPEDKFAHLLELMKKFEICFQIPRTQTYIVPELLRLGRPEFEWDYADNLRFEYRYEFMPAGIITRFIVRTHDIVKEEIYWKNGVILERENTEALVISERLHRKISIWIRGDKKKELMAIIRREIDYIHNTLNNPDVKEMIPCICSQCATAEQAYFYDYQTLCRFRAKGKIACEKSTEDVSIEKLLGEYEHAEDKEKMEHRRREEDIHVELKPHIEFKPTIEQKQVIEQRLPVESPKKRKRYKTWKVIWAIIAGIFLILGGIWAAIQIYEHFHNLESKHKTEQKQNENKAFKDGIQSFLVDFKNNPQKSHFFKNSAQFKYYYFRDGNETMNRQPLQEFSCSVSVQ